MNKVNFIAAINDMPPAKREAFGMSFIFLGAILWSLLSIVVKVITIDPVLFCALRALIAGTVLAPSLFLSKNKLKFNKYLVIMVLSYTVLNLTLVLSLKHTTTSIAIGMQFTAPLWIFIVSFLLGKRLPRKELIPLALILIGVLIFMLSPGEGATFLGNILAFIAGLAFALLTAVSGKAGQSNPIAATAVANWFACVVMFTLSIPNIGNIANINDTTWVWIVFIAIVQTAGGFTCFNLGLKYAPTHKASILSTAELVFSVLFVALFIKELPNIYDLLGVIFIMLGIIVQVFLEGRKLKQSQTAKI